MTEEFEIDDDIQGHPIDHPLAETRAPFEGTCDVCAGEGGALIVHVDPDSEAYVCQTCWDHEEASIQAGADALLTEFGYTWDDDKQEHID